MTSKKSFWADLKENNKRRIWVWVVSILSQLAAYPGVMLIYLSRIRSNESNGYYKTIEAYKKALQEAAADAVGFQISGRTAFFILALAVLIGFQGFLWLHDRRKLDLYKSVPVKDKDRFLILYVNSILIFLLPHLCCLILSLLIGAAKGAVSGFVLGKCALTMLTNLIYFLVNLHLVILVMALTGNWLIAGFGIVALNLLEEAVQAFSTGMKNIFFHNANYAFRENRIQFCSLYDYLGNASTWKRQTTLSGLAGEVFPVLGKWVILAVILFILAYLCYQKRPAEMVGKAMVFPMVWSLIKIVFVVVGASGVAMEVYVASYHNIALTVLAILAATSIACGIMEVLFEFNIRDVFKHLFSTGAAVVIGLAIFFIYQFDLFGYDTYIPDNEKIESVAFFTGNYTQDYWEYFDGMDGKRNLSMPTYLEENMFLQDTEAVTELAKKSMALWEELNEKGNETAPTRGKRLQTMSVLYRLTSGRKVARSFQVDLADAETAKLMDRIIGTQEFIDGQYMLAKHEECLSDPALRLYYTNGSMQLELSPSDAGEIREAWLADMKQYNYTFAVEHEACGKVMMNFDTYYAVFTLPVYESFENTIAVLKEKEVYYPLLPPVSAVESVEVTNFNYVKAVDTVDTSEHSIVRGYAETAVEVDYAYNEERAVTVTYEEPEQIEKILQGIYPDDMAMEWVSVRNYDEELAFTDVNYIISIAFKHDTEYPYKKVQGTYSFKNGCVPDFVEKDTVYTE